jgi:WD domain, G-beta repeat
LQLEFVRASEQEDERRTSAEAQQLREIAEARTREAVAQKQAAEQARRVAQRTLAGLVAAVVLALLAGAIAVYAIKERNQALVQEALAKAATQSANEQRQAADDQRDLAQKATIAANEQRDRALLQESRALTILAQDASAQKAGGTGDQPTAMLLALEALPGPGFGGARPLSYEAAAALHQAWLRNRETTLAGHHDAVNVAAFSPDGAHVVTASWDKTARVWDLRGDKPSFVALEGHQGEVVSAAFSPDGSHVVTASWDKTARVWRVYPDVNELISLVRPRLSRCLSQAQRDEYGLPSTHPAEDRNFIPPPTADGRCPS